jgi:hypothetical protein
VKIRAIFSFPTRKKFPKVIETRFLGNQFSRFDPSPNPKFLRLSRTSVDLI